jgi:hypothetical protein
VKFNDEHWAISGDEQTVDLRCRRAIEHRLSHSEWQSQNQRTADASISDIPPRSAVPRGRHTAAIQFEYALRGYAQGHGALTSQASKKITFSTALMELGGLAAVYYIRA